MILQGSEYSDIKVDLKRRLGDELIPPPLVVAETGNTVAGSAVGRVLCPDSAKSHFVQPAPPTIGD